MAAHWPLIRNMMVYNHIEKGKLTAQHLYRIGRSCPKLERLILIGSITPLDFVNLLALSEEDKAPLFPSLRDLDLGIRLFCHRSEPNPEASTLFVKSNEIIQTQSFNFEDTAESGTVIKINRPKRSLAPHATKLIASRIETTLLTLMPRLIVCRSYEVRHWAMFPDPFETYAHEEVLVELCRRFDARCPPARCDLRGWCECWRIFDH